MVKKITIYTAFGQFLGMIERQAEREMEQAKELDTDRYPLDHPLSDYQNGLTSIQVRSCPVEALARPQLVKKSISCPLASFAFSHEPQLAISPVPTTTETKKLNEATELMMSFWKIHVTTRRPEQKQPAEDKPISLFEKFNGLFATPSTTSVVSLFGKFEELFEEMVEVVNEKEELVWMSPDQPSFPQLPVFVKSPVDSLKIYKGCVHTTDYMADDELTQTENWKTVNSIQTSESSSSPTSSSSTSTTIISRPFRLFSQIRLQEAIIREQQKIIVEQQKIAESMTVLQTLTQQLDKLNH